MNHSGILQLSIGDAIPERRFSTGAVQRNVELSGRPVRFRLSAAAMRALTEAPTPIVAELELYFSCLVRKQVRFRPWHSAVADTDGTRCASVVPGLFADFRAVTTRECRIADVQGKPPVERLPVKRSGLFVPDWASIDYHAGRWRGEFGFQRSL